ARGARRGCSVRPPTPGVGRRGRPPPARSGGRCALATTPSTPGGGAVGVPGERADRPVRNRTSVGTRTPGSLASRPVQDFPEELEILPRRPGPLWTAEQEGRV